MKRINNYFPESLTIPASAKIAVYNLTSPRTGEAVKNQFCIRVPLAGVVRFQSYNTTCLCYDSDTRILTVYPEAFGYSMTTTKYSKQFLREELNLSEAYILEIVKMAKTEDFGRDCPLYISFE